MNNTRFATAIHILTILARQTDEWVNSDWIAGSISINPAMVRKELSALQSAGLVVGRKGKEGGSRLNRAPRLISLADVYLAVKNTDVLGKKNLHTSNKCPVGKNINENLERLFTETDRQVTDALKEKTLEDFVSQFA